MGNLPMFVVKPTQEGREHSRRGQTSVEYILLIAVIAASVAFMKTRVVDGTAQRLLPGLTSTIRNEASQGGRSMDAYYRKDAEARSQ
jgi:hypothetical protein